MSWEGIAAVIAISALLAVRALVNLIDVEFNTALTVRRLVNESKAMAEAKLRVKLEQAAEARVA